jgi:hypothetical protein
MNNQKPRYLRAFTLLVLLFPLAISACNQEPTPDDSLPQTTKVTSAPAESSPSELTKIEVLVTDTAQPTEALQETVTLAPTIPLVPIGGIELHNITENGGLGVLRNTNTYWIRNNGLFWEDVEPIEGNRNWEALAKLDTELQAASEQGYEVILIIRKAPEWARMVPDYNCSPIKPEKIAAFANFMHDVVVKYSASPYHVKYWELGNEPDVDHKFIRPNMPFGCWGDDQEEHYGGSYYAEMLKADYPQIKAADPEAQVLVGGLLLDCDPVIPPETSPGSGEYKNCSSSKFFEGILQNGGGDFFDGVSFHAYDYYFGEFAKYGNSNWHSSWDTTGPTLITKANYLQSLLGAYGYPEKFLINTETAVICGSDGTEPQCQAEEFDRTKANYAAQSFSAALAEGLRGNVWYSITGWRGSGLVKSDLQPTFASTGYQFSLHMLENVAYLGPISEFPGAFGYKFRKDGQDFWVVWGIQETPQSIDLPEVPQAIYDVYGNPLPVSQTIELTLNVIYLEFAP